MACDINLGSIIVKDRKQSDGAITIPVNNEADRFMISARGSGAGVLTFEIEPHDVLGFEEIIDPKTSLQQEIDLSTNILSFILTDVFANAFKITPVGVSGTYTIVIQQGNV